MTIKYPKLKTVFWSMICGVMYIEDICGELRSILVSDDITSTGNMLVPLCNKIASIKSKFICLSVNVC